MRSLYGVVGGGPAAFISPNVEGWAGGGAPVLFSVGYNGTVASSLTGETGVMLNKVAAEAPVLSVDAGGVSTFGNNTARTAIDASVAALRSKFGATRKLVLVGLSMGFCDLMSWAQAHPNDVAGAIGVVGLADLNEQYAANREVAPGANATALINTAYGGVYDPAVDGPVRSAMEFTESMPFPVHYFYSTTDALIPVERSLAYEQLTNVTAYSIGARAHGTESIAATHAHAQFLPSLADLISSA